MQEFVTSWDHPELRQLVEEASLALARLDATSLEELALSCQALNRDLQCAGHQDRARLKGQARAAQGDMAVFARVLDATRHNLHVMNRLRELRSSRLEYTEGHVLGCAPTEYRHGNH